MRPSIAAIDPGAGGAIVWYDSRGFLCSEYMPDGVEGISKLIQKIVTKFPDIRFYVEDVGGYMPGNSGPAAAKFARHCGVLDGVLCTVGVWTMKVRPQKWMGTIPRTKFERILKSVEEPEKKRELARRKAIHKKEIKEFIVRKFPLEKVTLKNADALGILYWAETYGLEL